MAPLCRKLSGSITPKVTGSIRSARAIEVLSKLVTVHGAPKYPDNGPEFVSRAVLKWLTTAQINTAHIDPGKPWPNGSNESFNGKFRDECLDMQWFKNRFDARMMIEEFRHEFDEMRPHSRLGQLPLLELKRKLSQSRSEPELLPPATGREILLQPAQPYTSKLPASPSPPASSALAGGWDQVRYNLEELTIKCSAASICIPTLTTLPLSMNTTGEFSRGACRTICR